MPVLSVIMREAEAMGLRPEGSNPCRGIRRYRRKGRERFLSDEEIHRLSATLSAHADRRPGQVAVIRLLLLTGCRKSEILTLRWSDYREGHLSSATARQAPEPCGCRSRPGAFSMHWSEPGPWVFQAAQGNRPRSAEWLNRFWRRVRTETDLCGVRLHDLRHTHASLALRQGKTILAIGNCSDTAVRRRRSNTRILPTQWSTRPPRQSAPCWRAERWCARNTCGSPTRPSPACAPASGNIRSGTAACPVSGSGFGRPVDAAGFPAQHGWRDLQDVPRPGALKTVEQVRRECHVLSAAPGNEREPEEIGLSVPSFRGFVAGAWKEAHFNRYKPSTRKGVRYVLAKQLLPAFGSKPLDRISPAQIRRWFDAYSQTAPGGANHALDLLRQIMNFAVACGHIDANPARGVKRNRRSALTRFLSREEIGRLHKVLDDQSGESRTQQADIIRLLLLTGCRRSEIVQLRWSEVRDDVLALADSKTGPRNVPLNAGARRILERQPECGSPFVFLLRAIRPVRAVSTFRYGIGSARKHGSRMSAFTTCAIRWRATR